MSESLKTLQNLVTLAEEPSSEKRRELLEGVTDLFMDGIIAANSREMALASDILKHIAAAVEETLRAELSDRFADLENAPPDLIRQLASDVIDVTAPVLIRSGVLQDPDLIAIVESKGQAHQLAITQRPAISAAVSDALVANGDDAVIESLVRNDGAEISRQSMERIVSRAEEVEPLHQPVLDRSDLPPDLMHEMFWCVSSALKRLILERTSIDEMALDRALEETEAQLVSHAAVSEASLSQAERQVRRMARFGQLTPLIMLDFLAQGLIPEFIAALAMVTDTDLETARRIAFSPGYEALAVACRAAGLDHQVFGSIVRRLAENGGARLGDRDERRQLLELYDRTPVQTARRAMRFWRVRRQSLIRLSA